VALTAASGFLELVAIHVQVYGLRGLVPCRGNKRPIAYLNRFHPQYGTAAGEGRPAIAATL